MTSAVIPHISDYSDVLTRQPHRKGGRRLSVSEKMAVDEPQVSIVTVVRNGERHIRRAISCVLRQDYPHVEHIVIDGGSSDGTIDALEEIGERIELWVSEPDRGISDAFNKGIALAHGDIIGLLNSDDWYVPGAIRSVVNAFTTESADIVYGFLQYWDEAERPTFRVESDHRFLDRSMTIGHPAVFVKRDLYERIGLFRTDFRLAMDYEWLLRATQAGARFSRVPEVLANMTDGGVGDRQWVASLREVGRARAIHISSASNPVVQRLYFWKGCMMGWLRRRADAAGLRIVRRLRHRLFSLLRIR